MSIDRCRRQQNGSSENGLQWAMSSDGLKAMDVTADKVRLIIFAIRRSLIWCWKWRSFSASSTSRFRTWRRSIQAAICSTDHARLIVLCQLWTLRLFDRLQPNIIWMKHLMEHLKQGLFLTILMNFSKRTNSGHLVSSHKFIINFLVWIFVVYKYAPALSGKLPPRAHYNKLYIWSLCARVCLGKGQNWKDNKESKRWRI